MQEAQQAGRALTFAFSMPSFISTRHLALLVDGRNERRSKKKPSVDLWYLGDVELVAANLDGNDVRVVGIPSLKFSHLCSSSSRVQIALLLPAHSAVGRLGSAL